MYPPLQSTTGAIILALNVFPIFAGQDVDETLIAEEKPYTFKLSISPAGGYNSNVILLGEGLPLPPSISRQDAAFFEIGSAATFDWKSAPIAFAPDELLSTDQVTLSYEYKADFYEGISGFDPGVHAWSGKYTHLFDKQWGYRIETKDIYTTIDGHGYSNKTSVTPVITLQAAQYAETIAKDLSAEFIFSFMTADFYFPPSLPARNMDANNYSAECSITFVPKKYDVAKFKIGFVHFRNDADGSDYDYDRNRLQLSVETRFSRKPEDRLYDLKAIIKYFHDFDRYDHANSHAGFAFSRQDDRDDLGAGLTFDVLKSADRKSSRFAVNIQYHYLRDNSNVPFFNYPQHTIQAGCTYTFDELKWR